MGYFPALSSINFISIIYQLAEGLSSALVTSYKDIQAQLDLGTTNRSIASTNMNATSR